MSSERCRILSPYLFQPSSLTLNLKEEVKHRERQVDSEAHESARVGSCVSDSRISLCTLHATSSCSLRSKEGRRCWRTWVAKVPLWMIAIWNTLADCDGILALPAKILCVVIMALIICHPAVLWLSIMSKPAPLCYILYFLFLFYVSTLLIVGSVIGYLREGG